ncbi:MAG: hypothetical protein P8X42_15850 [Calditrichaceae bacterium]|jgi:hypothetical protein
MIKRKDGAYFIVRPVNLKKSPLDVKGVDTNFSIDEIINVIREMREHS